MSLDNFRNRTIIWDTVNKDFPQPIQIMQGDVNARTLLIKVLDNGAEVDLTGHALKLTYQYTNNSNSGFVMITPKDLTKGEFILVIPTEMTVTGVIDGNLILLNESLEQVIVSKSLTFISDNSTVTDLAQEVNNKIDDFTKLLLENMPQVMRSELNDLHAQTESNKNNIELKANLADMNSLQNAMTNLQNEVEAFGITPENLVTIKSLLDEITSILSDLSQKGIDISDLKAKMNAIYNNALADHAEITQARDGLPSLDARLDGLDAKIVSIADGSPKGTFATLSALQSAYPNGTEGVFLVLENGHWYYYASGWKDGGVYQAMGIADGSVTPKKISFNYRQNAFVLTGKLDIDSINKTVSISSGSTISNNDGYTYVSSAQTVSFSEYPAYVLFSGSNLIVAKNSDISSLIANYNTRLLFTLNPGTIIAANTNNIYLNGFPVSYLNGNFDYTGETIVIDYGKTLTVPKDLKILANKREFKLDWLSETQIQTISGSANIMYLVADFFTKEIKVTTSVGRSQAVLASFDTVSLNKSEYSNIKMTTDKLYRYGTSVSDISGLKNVIITDTDSVKTIFYPKGHIFVDDATGYYYYLNADSNLDFIDFQTGSKPSIGGVVTSVWLTGTKGYGCSLYVDFTKHNPSDKKVFSYYAKKVYADESVKKTISVNGVGNGGWTDSYNSSSTSTMYTVEQLSLDLENNEVNTICFYGDSTTEGASGGNPDNAYPNVFKRFAEKELNRTINVINGGHGGKSVGWARDNCVSYFGTGGEYASSEVVFVGFGLNNGRDISNYAGSKEALKTILNTLIALNKKVFIMTTQASSLTKFSSDIPPSYSRNQWAVYAYENKMRRELSKEMNIDLLDIEKVTSRFNMFSRYLENQINYDRLHYSDIGHLMEGGYIASRLLPRSISFEGDLFVTPTLQNIKSDVDWTKINNLSQSDQNGFRSQIALDTLVADTLIYDTILFNNNKGVVKLIGSATNDVDVYINDTKYTLNAENQTILANVEMGLYRIQVFAKGNTGYFKGLKFVV